MVQAWVEFPRCVAILIFLALQPFNRLVRLVHSYLFLCVRLCLVSWLESMFNQSVHHFIWNQNRWIAVKLYTDIHGPQRKNRDDLDQLVTGDAFVFQLWNVLIAVVEIFIWPPRMYDGEWWYRLQIIVVPLDTGDSLSFQLTSPGDQRFACPVKRI